MSKTGDTLSAMEARLKRLREEADEATNLARRLTLEAIDLARDIENLRVAVGRYGDLK